MVNIFLTDFPRKQRTRMQVVKRKCKATNLRKFSLEIFISYFFRILQSEEIGMAQIEKVHKKFIY